MGISSSKLETGTLVKVGSVLHLIPYSKAPLHVMHLSPLTLGHGWTGPQEVEVVAPAGTFHLIAVQKGVIPEDDMGQIITRERLRAIGEGVAVGTSDVANSPGRSAVHWCRVCGPCQCYKKRSGVRL